MGRKRNIGSIPGTFIYTGSKTSIPVSISYLQYNQDNHLEESALSNGEVIIRAPDTEHVQWYDIRGLHDIGILQQIASAFKIHPLAIEDAVDVHQRPSYIEYADAHFISLKLLSFDKEESRIRQEAISIYFGDKFIITFQEHGDDAFKPIRERIIQKKGRVVQKGADYLAYLLVDQVVDQYFQTLDLLEEEIEHLEEVISFKPDKIDKLANYQLKKNVLRIRKSVAPLREAINLFSRSESELVDSKTITFIRDVYDHTIQVIDNIDSMRDILSGLQDLHISEVSLRMNKVMQVLTIITAIFVPISFLAGLYGMNFEYMPELSYRNSYFILLGLMMLIVSTMLIFFKKNKWF